MTQTGIQKQGAFFVLMNKRNKDKNPPTDFVGHLL